MWRGANMGNFTVPQHIELILIVYLRIALVLAFISSFISHHFISFHSIRSVLIDEPNLIFLKFCIYRNEKYVYLFMKFFKRSPNK